MNKIEQEIKNRLAQSTSMEGVDSEALWAGISKTIKPANAFTKKRRFGFILFLMSLVSIGSIWTIIVLNDDSTLAYSPRIESKTEQYMPNTSSIPLEDSFAAAQKDITPSSITLAKGTKEENAYFPIIGDTTRLAGKGFDGITGVSQNPEVVVEKVDYSSYSISQVGSNQDQKNISQDKTNKGLSFDTDTLHEADPLNTKQIFASTVDTGFTKTNSPFDVSLDLISQVSNDSLTPIKDSQQVTKNTLSWKLYGGAVFIQNNFKTGNSDFKDSLNQSLSTQLGYSVGGLLRIKQGKNWNLNVGMEYAEWQDRFDKVFLSDSMVEINQKEVLVQNIRTIQHFNTASIITLPVQLELCKDIERLRLGLNLGVSYSIVLDQSGRLMKDDFTIVNYSQSEKRFTNFVSVRFAPYIGYKINEKVMLGTFCNFGIQSHGTNSINQSINNSVAVMPSIGLTFNY